MLCQSWGGIVRIFPAIPSTWSDVALHDFRTQGAFLVSAVRQAGTTRFIRVRSLAGEPLRIKHGLPGKPVAVLDNGRPAHVKDLGDGILEITLGRNSEVLLYTGARPKLTIAPVKAEPAEELPAAGPLAYEGLTFAFPAYADGAKNNVTAKGQTITVPPGTYAKARLLGAASSGVVSVTLIATYTDGSAAEVPFSMPDWGGQAGAGITELLRCTHRHGRAGQNALKVGLFIVQAVLDPAKELRSLTLPTLTKPQLHLFALSLAGRR
ncbi:glycoside hydrolase family 95-like protein [Nonomuraea sp. NPDC050680]|uniref:glycoside hydrolase family 95-like protein n=1 Tax=Nonomuraea sp. NPDC050680 TaxID=3154630 RepID=UPI0033DFC0E8